MRATRRRIKNNGRSTFRRRTNKKFQKYEREIAKFGREYLENLQNVILEKIVPRVRDLARSFEAERIARVRDQESNDLNDIIDVIEAQFLGRFSRNFIRRNIREFFGRLGFDADEQAITDFSAMNLATAPTDIDIEVIENAINTVTSNFETIGTQTIQDVRNQIASGVAAGERWETIAERLSERVTSSKKLGGEKSPFNKAYNRMKFTARNAVSNSLGQINRGRQQSAGIQLYTWETSDDERVRDTHADLDGKVFSWDPSGYTDPETGQSWEPARDPNYQGGAPTIPGQPYNCRCFARPYLPELEE